MLELGAPAWLVALPLLLVIWWLHRLRQRNATLDVAALFLWDAAPHRHRGGAKLARRAEPLWLLRAAIAALLIFALAAPGWRAESGRVVIWIDDSLSMQAATAEGTRRERALDALTTALTAAAPAVVTLRALSDPAASLELRGAARGANSADLRADISTWLQTLPPREADWPAPIELDVESAHWLVTDAAAPGIAEWLAAAPVARIIEVGEPASNVAVTRLAVRTSAAAPERWSGLIEVANASAAPVERGLRVHADGAEVARFDFRLAPKEAVQQEFDLPGAPRHVEVRLDDAGLEGGDALAADDALELTLPPLRLPAALRGSCGPTLSRALEAHPRLTVGGADPALLIVCGDAPSAGTLPTLRVHAGEPLAEATGLTPAWTAGAGALAEIFLDAGWLTPLAGPIPAGEPWLYLGGRPAIVHEPGASPTLHVLLDLEQRDFGVAPEFPVFVARLLAALEPVVALDPIVASARPRAASDLEPVPLPVAADGEARAADVTLPLRGPLATAALVLLVFDVGLMLRRYRTPPRPRSIRAALALRGVAALALTLALLGPDALGGGRAHDLIVIWDESASVDDATQAPAWTQLAAVASELPRGSRLSLLRFAAGVSAEANRSPEALARLAAGEAPQSASLMDRGASRLAPALKTALRLADPGRPTAVALFTDGHVDAAEAVHWLERAAAIGLPVHSIGRPAESDIVLTVRAPAAALTGRPVPIDVTVRAAAATSGQLSLVVDGEVSAEVALQLDERAPAAVRFELVAPAGLRTVQVNWRDAARVVARIAAIDVGGQASWLGLSRGPGTGGLAALANAGWTLETIRPENFAAVADRLGDFGGIVLDDIAVGDLPPSAWSRLEHRIARDGGSLLVLGGPRSFGTGGYRHSALEALLPLTAEARNPREMSAVLFVLDVSGSMGRSLTASDPMGYARRAVVETAKALGATDEVGLIAFDVEAHRALPLDVYPDAAAALEASFTTLGPSGGTRLRPALAAALAELSATEITRRLLVLVSDGFLDDEQLASQLEAIEARGIEIIALAVGRDADRLALRELVDDEHLFRVEQISELPQLMRSEVERRRRPMHLGESPVRRVNALPGAPSLENLAPVTGYMLTRAKPSAAVYLESTAGDPLLSAHYAGAGRVAAMPAGLGAWARGWTDAAEWPDFSAALGTWLADDASDAYTRIGVEETTGGVRVTVDALAPGGGWAREPGVELLAVDPQESLSSRVLPRVAPGRYAAVIEMPLFGSYLLRAQREPAGARFAHHRSAALELDSVQEPSALRAWLATGLVHGAPSEPGGWRFSAGRAPGVPAWLIALSALAFLVSLGLPHGAAFATALRRPGGGREPPA